MIFSFADIGAEDIFHGRNTRSARQSCPRELWPVARRKLDQLNAATRIDSLRLPPGNRLESLKGNRTGQHGIRINDQFRICFRWNESGAAAVEIVDYH